eukprot:CAMPEP_0203870918 /NCGR_PEP_ID=MMETSP0359-20131031/18475_1 /ASSEMBLY_ACC=CAM_ASM_000338 /TAXON_ID=268821 /ORGANISM="Scrippsiella Hangoei, Strain SHTV-5" /LENGTH=630 /DNA_ID=CAMNT_0050789589 /DNA_START=206 /DNA_END=2098 /DNA_ORIENTATION=+
MMVAMCGAFTVGLTNPTCSARPHPSFRSRRRGCVGRSGVQDSQSGRDAAAKRLGGRRDAQIDRVRESLEKSAKLEAQAIEVGDEVEVDFLGSWVPCSVLQVAENGVQCTVRYLDGGEEESFVDIASRLRKIEVEIEDGGSDAVAVGDDVEVNFLGMWHGCTVLRVSSDGNMCTVKYHEGGEEESDIDIASRVRRGGAQEQEVPAVQETAQQVEGSVEVAVGDKVEVNFLGIWHACTVSQVSSDGGMCTVKYHEGGEEESEVDIATRVRPIAAKKGKVDNAKKGKEVASRVQVATAPEPTSGARGRRKDPPPKEEKAEPVHVEAGDHVEVDILGVWQIATVLDVSDDGSTCEVRLRDGSGVEPDVDVASRVRKLLQTWLRPGMKVDIESEGKWWSTMVLWVDPGGRMCTAQYDDDENIEQHISIDDRVRRTKTTEQEFADSRIPFDSLVVGQALKGKVTTVRESAIFVDVHTEIDGFVPRHLAGAGWVPDIRGVVKTGQEVTVWISKIGGIEGNRKLEISLVESKVRKSSGGKNKGIKDVSGFIGVDDKRWFKGTIRDIRKFGMFVEVSSPKPECPSIDGVVHLSQVADKFIKSLKAEGFHLGQKVDVRVTKVDTTKQTLNLSMLPIPQES